MKLLITLQRTTQLLALTLISVLILSGCRTTKEVEQINTGHSESESRQEYHSGHSVDIIRDTLLRKDSVIYYIQGDTVRISEYHTIYKSQPSIQIRTDTLVKTDTVVVRDTLRQTSIKTIENKKHDGWSFLLILAVGALLVGALYLYSRKRT